ncbi:TolC family protein [Polynucleobacter paneuropaeus]|nr:TolC family protein [Polynucleobacter paneuropaeus]MBT8615752.1 TolC family protein [Polynucleobacter paneuropaeus]MBT8617633.1 TolC family protein [Polynucleobacter paneuropaeus]MBT8619514.1 TolC family protein [Polynucleobacter paneuropaeus]MBT8625049.1 TolC family protein [Polynucleobacter paneuropaeus]
MKKISISIYSFLFTSFFVTGVQAQSLPPFKVDNTQYRSVSLGNYLSELNEENANLKIRRLNIASADANAKDAGMPYLSPILTYARGSMYTQAPYAGYTNPASNTLGAMITIEGWGKRSAREAQAQADAKRKLAEMITEGKAIETEAMFNYIDALRTKLLWQSYQEAIDALNQYRASGSTQAAEFIDAQKVLANDLKYYSYGMANFVGKTGSELIMPVGTLNIEAKNFKVEDLIARAQENRADIASGQAAVESAAANLEVVKASKNIDFLPGVYYTQTPSYASSGINYGTQQAFSFLLNVPLGNGFLMNSDVTTAANSQAELEVSLMATKAKIVTEINQTYLQYQSAKERLEAATKAYNQAKMSKNNIQGILRFRDAEYELFDARTVHAKTLILLERLSGNFEVPNLH